MRTITIEFADRGYTVRDGDRYHDQLCWDEMLGTVAELTHPKIGAARYPMRTAQEWQAREEAQQRRLAEIRAEDAAEDPDFDEVPRSTDATIDHNHK